MKALDANYQYAPLWTKSGQRCSERKSLADELRSVYISKYSERGRFETHTSLPASQPVKIVKYKELEKTEIVGYPFAIDRDERGELQCHFPVGAPNAHELIIGATGCGKTTSLVEPRIRVLSSKKNQANLFVTDPKGEIFQRNAGHLRRAGYKVFLLNFKDVLHTIDTWNPLSEIYDIWIQQKDLKVTQILGEVPLKEYELQDNPVCGQDTFWICDGKAFCSESAAKRYWEDRTADILSQSSDLICQLVYAFIPDAVMGKSDPSWGMGARDILAGVLYAMLEDALDERSGFTRDQFNLMNIQAYFEAIRSAVIQPKENIALLQTKLLAHKTDRDMSIKLLRSYLENAPTTTRCYVGIHRNCMQEFFNPKVFALTTGNTIDLDIDDRPYAIFLITRDFERSSFTIAGLLIDWVYRKLLEQADRSGGKLAREFYFILDEFSNIPAVKDFTNKITAARSRNIAFTLILQSYAQLNEVYGPNAAQTIIDNCDCVYFGARNYDTKSKFAKECGRQTIPSLEAVLNPASDKIADVPLLTVGRLEELRPGQMYMKRTGIPCLLLSECKPSFLCPEFKEEKLAVPEEMGAAAPSYNSEQYHYQYLESGLPLNEYCKAGERPGRESVKIDLPDYLQDIK